jgi:cytochrome c peroxidase
VHVLGVADHPSVMPPDTGAGGRNAFRTPSLRNVTLTAPYMHNGTVEFLSEALGFYQRFGDRNPRIARGQLDPLLTQVNLGTRLWDIADFVAALEGPFDKSIPARVPSGLKPGGR